MGISSPPVALKFGSAKVDRQIEYAKKFIKKFLGNCGI